jgi:TDG/mug DNA glycosylase family protein
MPLRSRGFPPIAAPDARVLILGSLPGQASLAAQQYYAQPRNAFWRIMGELFGAGPALPYHERAARLAASGIALWDVCKAAHRPGSLDASIDLTSVVVNDFVGFYRDHPRIVAVFTNGGTATRLYQRLVWPRLGRQAQSLPLQPLPSTSPAHASLSLEQKLAQWATVVAVAGGSDDRRLP